MTDEPNRQRPGESEGFNPDWTLAPASALAEWLEEHGLTLEAAVRRKVRGRDAAMAMLQDVLNRKPLTARHAGTLSMVTGVSVAFWLNYESNYRNDLAAGRKDVTDTGIAERFAKGD
jgi:plasmid maintenance system antidote protein VapI